ncbi:MAG: hypothetical protein QNJ46_01880 [Leptolyngbyaceae cyanobacterium MO_188.B28]|nr:hypothetical protein [Leptolyngbyaceae cyanobacterium MO_188.B28]
MLSSNIETCLDSSVYVSISAGFPNGVGFLHNPSPLNTCAVSWLLQSPRRFLKDVLEELLRSQKSGIWADLGSYFPPGDMVALR